MSKLPHRAGGRPWLAVCGAILAALVAAAGSSTILVILSLHTPHAFKVSSWLPLTKSVSRTEHVVPPLVMLDVHTTQPFSRALLDEYIHVVKRERRPIVLRQVLSPERIASLSDAFLERACNKSGKYIANNRLESHTDVTVRDALHIAPEGGLYQGLNSCNRDMLRAVELPLEDEYYSDKNQTAMVIARNFHTRYHAHPDVTVHFAIRNSKHWAILHESENPNLDMKFGRTIPIGTSLFINQTQHMKRWEFDTHQGDLLLIPPWGFHGIEYLQPDTTVSFLLVVYENGIALTHPVLSISYFVNLLSTNWRVVWNVLRDDWHGRKGPQPLAWRIQDAIAKEVYGKH